MEEFWVPVLEYEGLYEVSNLGRVRSLSRTVVSIRGTIRNVTGRVLASPCNNAGYPQVVLYRFGRRKQFGVHVLVAIAFHGERPEGMFACHNDGNSNNNIPENIRWDTPSGNQLDRILHGTNHEINKTHCPRGHAYIGKNLITTRKGHRQCRECKKYRDRAYAEKNKRKVSD